MPGIKTELSCYRCYHVWVRRTSGRLPIECPMCKRRDWFKPEVKRRRSSAEIEAGREESGVQVGVVEPEPPEADPDAELDASIVTLSGDHLPGCPCTACMFERGEF